ncbi:MAG: MFS transporter [Actinomycetota bacterium]|nr:MFS transporter [Actinomycetota bacterium]
MLGAYGQVLLIPHALPMIAVGFIGRLPLSMVGLGCLLVVEDYTGSYALGGAVAATGAVTTSLFGPLLGRAADAFGQRRVLLPTLAVFVLAGSTFLWTVREDQPRWLMFLAAGVAGACIPPISSMLRTRWTYLLKGSARLPTALAFESVMDEFTFIVGPVLVTFLSTTGHTTSGVVTAFVLAAVGGLLFAAQRKTEPPPGGAQLHRGPSAMRTPGLRVLCVVGFVIGGILGDLQVSLVAFAEEQGAYAMSGVLIAALAVGSMTSGILWGALHFRTPLGSRLISTLTCLTLLSIPLTLIGDIWPMVIAVALFGFAISPSLITSFTLVERLVPEDIVTEGFTWVGTAVGLGVAVGASSSGLLVDLSGANQALLVATALALLGASTVFGFSHTLSTDSELAGEDARVR